MSASSSADKARPGAAAAACGSAAVLAAFLAARAAKAAAAVFSAASLAARAAATFLAAFSLAGEFRRCIGRRGTIPGTFHLPQSVAAARGFILVAEKRRLQVLTPDGTPQHVLSLPGSGSSLRGLSVRGARLLVADSEQRLLHELTVRRANDAPS